MYTLENLIDDVKKEAAALKVHATKEELENLCLEILDPGHIRKCVYGQMTGHCHSTRAIELLQSCAARYVVDRNLEEAVPLEGVPRILDTVSLTGVHDFTSGRGYDGYYSMLEAYILLPEAKNANLIAYLKGETETLEL